MPNGIRGGIGGTGGTMGPLGVPRGAGDMFELMLFLLAMDER